MRRSSVVQTHVYRLQHVPPFEQAKFDMMCIVFNKKILAGNSCLFHLPRHLRMLPYIMLVTRHCPLVASADARGRCSRTMICRIRDCVSRRNVRALCVLPGAKSRRHGSGTVRRSRLASAHVTRVQTGIANGMLLAQPGEEALETETVAAVGRGAVPMHASV